MNNPLYPWKNEGEIWLTNLLFRRGDISQTVANEILGAFASKKISMRDGIQFTNSREMIKLLDIAARKGVVCMYKGFAFGIQFRNKTFIFAHIL